jgi:Tfp pilus assembly protein PilV
LIFPNGTVERARKRFERKACIRKPVTAKIDHQHFLFTLNEWEHGQNFALVFQIKFSQCDIFKLYRWESISRHKNRLRWQKLISSRAIMDANTAWQKRISERL